MTSTFAFVFTALASASASAAAAASAAPSGGTGDAWEKAFIALAASVLGAGLAFAFNRLAQWRQEKNEALIAAHRILFCLLQQANLIIMYQKDVVLPREKSQIKFIDIPATIDFDLSMNLFDFDSFGFLLKSSKGRGIMYDLYFAQQSYLATFRAINERSREHRELLQPKIVEIGLGAEQPVSMSKLIADLGPRVCGTMQGATEQVLSLLPSSFEKVIKATTDFRAFAVQYFGTDDFTKFEFPETYGLTKSPK